MITKLPGSHSYHRILRAVGIGTWIFLGLPILSASTRSGYTLTSLQWRTWLVFFLLFGPAFWYSSSTEIRPMLNRVGALVLETVAVLGMTNILFDYFVGFLLVIVSWQVALLLRWRVAIIWMLIASALLLYFLDPHYYMGWRWGATGALLGFQAFAIVTAALARAESELREDQARVNAELVSTRELLRESCKLGERRRISRELHDSVGHHLTALCLHLEAALNGPADRASAGIQQAQAAAKNALEEVRTVVSNLHGSEEIDLHSVLRTLSERIPRVRLHLSLPDELRITDAARANSVLRCVQEITTNTLKHSDAANLWIVLRMDGDAIEIEARDDGHSSRRSEPGFGLNAMRQRFEELGGTVFVETGIDRGFLVRALLPSTGTGEIK
ncbi:MAG TPA: histidine kinase [Pyrinomonadaceae bacterium]|nr:histidine kinase [Pyrinomonadaceae bacterium]